MTPSSRHHHQRKRSTHLRPLSKLTERLVAPGLQKRSRFLAKLIADWPDIAGEAATYCLPVDVQFQGSRHSDGTLVLSVISGRGPQVQMMNQNIITQMNRSLGFGAIARIRLRQDMIRPAGTRDPRPERRADPMPDKVPLHKLEAATSQIQNPDLRAALIRLGRNLKY